jgi:hypothetical protein
MEASPIAGAPASSLVTEMQKIYDHLSALITTENPLTADDVFATSLLISLPSDWLSCVSNLLQNPKTPSATIVHTLKAEVLRRQSGTVDNPIEFSASANDQSSVSTKPCAFCKRTNHVTDNCFSLRDLVRDHSGFVNDHLKATLPSSSGNRNTSSSKGKSKKRTSRKPEKVSRTSIVTDDSGSEDEHTSSAVVFSISPLLLTLFAGISTPAQRHR